MDMSNEIAVPVGGQGIKQSMSQVQDHAISILAELPDGGYEIEFEFLTMKIDIESETPTGPMKMSFDSEAPNEPSNLPQNALLTGFQNILGHKLKLFLSPEHEVVRTEGLEEMMEKVISEAPPQVAQMTKSMYSESMFNNYVLPFGLPGKPVKPGDTWPVQFDQGMGPIGVMTMDNQFQFKNQETHEGRDCAVLVFSGTMRSKPSAEPGMFGGMIEITNGESYGKSWFDPELGRFIDTTVQQTMKINVDLGGGAGVSSMSMSMDLTQQVSVKLIKEEILSDL